MPMTYDEMLEIARRCDGEILETITGKEFRVGIYMDCPYFIPLSTGQGRSDGRLAAERFLDRFNQVGSFRPSDYQEVTRNASYFVALVQHP
jgi:hypothetical protein